MSVLNMPLPELDIKAAAEPTRADSPNVALVSSEQIVQYREEWTRLAAAAVVPNPFFEPWTLLPALQHLGEDTKEIYFLLVFGPVGKDGIAPLWGLFPLKVQSKCLGLPVRTLTFWQYRYCALASPLIEVTRVREVLDSFWRWFEKNPLGCKVLDTNYLLAEGPFHAVWTDRAIGRTALQVNEHPRCLQAAGGTLETYLSEVMSANHRRDNRRKERRLNELGVVTYHCAGTEAEAEAWIEAFLQLEANGWKGGADGGAFAKHPGDTAYFRQVIRTGYEEGRVWLLSLKLDGKDIAMKALFLSGEGSFSYKIAYAEEYWKQSPGVLLELDHLRRLFEQTQVQWSDTCAAPRHAMYEGISNRRRIIRRTIFSNNSRAGDILVSLLPALRCVKKQFRPRPKQAYLRISTE